jgi:hypothetical protein
LPVIEIGDFRVCGDPIQWGVRNTHIPRGRCNGTNVKKIAVKGRAFSVFLHPAMNNQALIDAAFRGSKQ